MSDVREYWECDCSCRNPGGEGKVHVQACCEECPDCRRRVATWMMGLHQQLCQARAAALEAATRGVV